MYIDNEVKLDFSDVLIKPKRSTLSSRSEVDINRKYIFYHSKKQFCGVPIIAANMDTVGTFAMAKEFANHDMMVALHKHYDIKQLVDFWFENKQLTKQNVFYSMGVTNFDIQKVNDFLSQLSSDLNYLCIDVANGYSEKFVDVIKQMREKLPNTTIMAGNVVTAEMTEALILSGVDIVKVGIGPGGMCTTRRMTGVGYPQLSAIIECADAAHGLGGHICADGGCTSPGDIAKAFGGGADFVMLGSMLAATDECEGEFIEEDTIFSGDAWNDARNCMTAEQLDFLDQIITNKKFMKFYGMSSKTAQKKHGGEIKNYRASEGRTALIPYKGPVEDVIQEILGGLRSTSTYAGARKLKELSKRTTFIRVNNQLNTTFEKNTISN